MLIGHSGIFERLKAQAAQGTLHHAQLFVGPEHVGKSKLAIELSMVLQEVTQAPVLRKQILDGVDADTIFLLDEGQPLSIKEVRSVIERTHQSHRRPYLVILIENIGRMRPEAMNALLKTLEEPPKGVIFFLTANQDEAVLPTIRSRCQLTSFHTVSDAILREACEGHVYTDFLVMFAMGRPGKLQRLKNERDYFEAHQKIFQEVNRFLEKPTVEAAFELSRTYEKHELNQEMLDILLHRVRTFALSGQHPTILKHLDFTETLESLETSKEDLQKNVNPKLVFENLLLPFAP